MEEGDSKQRETGKYTHPKGKNSGLNLFSAGELLQFPRGYRRGECSCSDRDFNRAFYMCKSQGPARWGRDLVRLNLDLT